MAVKSSGALSLTTDIVGEFGGVAPHSLSEYYGGGTYVPAGANPGIATSGQINMGSHYGAVAATVLTISSNTNNYDIGAAAIAAGGDKSTPVILTINAGVTVGSTSTSNPAMKTGTGWSSGTTINITNNGSIVGASGSNSSGKGAGGTGGRNARDCQGATSGSAGSSASGSGSNGGHAFEHSQTGDSNLSVIFDTAGTRYGGSAGTFTGTGGGGGGGGGGNYCRGVPDSENYFKMCISGSSGGGGAGSPGGGTSYTSSSCYCAGGYWYGNSGSTGGSTSGGSGGSARCFTYGYSYICGKAGGRGGNLATSGSAGVSGSGGGDCNNKGAGSGGAGGSNTSVTGTAGSALSGNTAQIN